MGWVTETGSGMKETAMEDNGNNGRQWDIQGFPQKP
jgi:hypothetical protein